MNEHTTSIPERINQEDFPEIVTLSGSTRFEDAYKEAKLSLSLEGKIALTVADTWKDSHEDDWDELDEADKELLDELHMRRIDLSDRVHVLNVDGYIGTSTRNEIEHAIETGTEVTWLEPENAPDEYVEPLITNDGGNPNTPIDSGDP